MLLYAIISCLWLLASGKEMFEDYRTRFHESSTPLPPRHLIAPEVLEGRETFIVLNYEVMLNQSTPRIYILVRKYDDHPGVLPKECPVDFYAGYNAKTLEVSAFRRVSEDKVVFAWYEETSNGDRVTKVVFLDMQFCNQFDFQPREFPGNALLVPSVSESFDVLVDDVKFCGQFGKRCRLSYDLKQRNYGMRLPFNVSLDWSTIYVERLPSGAFLIRGYENGIYKVTQMNHLTKQSISLTEITDPNRQIQFVSSGLTFCWILKPGLDRRVYCEMANERIEFPFTENLEYDEPVSLIDVHPVRADEQIFVVAKKFNCNSEQDCWVLYGTKLHRKQTQLEHVPLHFPCTGDQKQLTVFDATPEDEYHRIDLHYACRRNNSYTFSVFYVY